MRTQQTWLPWLAFILVTWIVGFATGVAVDRYAFPSPGNSVEPSDVADDPTTPTDEGEDPAAGEDFPSGPDDSVTAEAPQETQEEQEPATPAVDPTAAEGVWAARHLFVSVGGQRLADDARKVLGELKPGGVVLREGNLRDAAQTRALVREIKLAVGLGTGHADLPLIAVEEMSNRLPSEPILMASELGAKGDEEEARQAGEAFAAACIKWGVSVVFAPVLDIYESGAVFPDLRTQSFGADGGLVARMGHALADGLESGGVLPVAKHFPGYGAAAYDEQDGMLLVLDRDYTGLAGLAYPFSEAASENIPGIMVGHVAVPLMDTDNPKRPASLSPFMVRTIFRNRWSYDGVILADDMALNAAMRVRPIERAVVQALAAGCDAVVFLDPDPAHLRATCEAITDAVDSGELSKEQLDSSKRRLDEWLERLSRGLLGNGPTAKQQESAARPPMQTSALDRPAVAPPLFHVPPRPEAAELVVAKQTPEPIEGQNDPEVPSLPEPVEVANTADEIKPSQVSEKQELPEETPEAETPNPEPIEDQPPVVESDPIIVAAVPDPAEEPSVSMPPVETAAEESAPDVVEATVPDVPEPEELAPSEEHVQTEEEPLVVARKEPDMSEVSNSIPTQTRMLHLVQRDQTLADVALFYGVTSAELEAWNNLTGNDVWWGTELEVFIPEDELDTLQARRIVEGYVKPATVTHVVRSDDTLTSLALRYEVQPLQLLRWNNLEDRRIETGDELKVLVIPEPKAEPKVESPTEPEIKVETQDSEPPATVFTRYTVKKFDNLRKIAERYGVSSEAIQELNNLKDPNHIWIGQRLKIPQLP